MRYFQNRFFQTEKKGERRRTAPTLARTIGGTAADLESPGSLQTKPIS